MIGAQKFADLWMHARLTATDRFDFWLGTLHLIHVGRRTADVTDSSFELRIRRHRFDFVDDRLLATRLDRTSLMSRDRTERAATKTATHNRDRILDHLERRNRIFVSRMRSSRVRQTVNRIHGVLGNRKLWRIYNNRLRAVNLSEPFRVVRVRFLMDDSRRVRKGDFVCFHFFEGWNRNRVFVYGNFFAGAERIRHAAHVAQVLDGFASVNSLCHFDDWIFAHPKANEIRFRIEQNGFANVVAPIVVVRQSP